MVDSTKSEECGGDGKEIATESVLRDLDDAPLREDIDTQRKRATSKGWLCIDGLASELVLRRRISMLGRFLVVVPFFQGAYLLWTEWPSRLESAQAYLGGLSELAVTAMLLATAAALLFSSLAVILDSYMVFATPSLWTIHLLDGVLLRGQQHEPSFRLSLFSLAAGLSLAYSDAKLNRLRDDAVAVMQACEAIVGMAHRVPRATRYKFVSTIKMRTALYMVLGAATAISLALILGIKIVPSQLALLCLPMLVNCAMAFAIGAGAPRRPAVILAALCVGMVSWWSPLYAGMDRRQWLLTNWGTLVYMLLVVNLEDILIKEDSVVPV